jgi:hypothetical protein
MILIQRAIGRNSERIMRYRWVKSFAAANCGHQAEQTDELRQLCLELPLSVRLATINYQSNQTGQLLPIVIPYHVITYITLPLRPSKHPPIYRFKYVMVSEI